MPTGFGELTSLQHLSHFIVGKLDSRGGKSTGVGALSGLMLKEELDVEFRNVKNCWNGDECWELPVTVQALGIWDYPGIKIPRWSSIPNIVKLRLIRCRRVKQLPPLRCLPYLKELMLFMMDELEYVEEENNDVQEDGATLTSTTSFTSSTFFPSLKKLNLHYLPELKGWSRNAEAATKLSIYSFPLLSDLAVEACPKLKSVPLCPRLLNLSLGSTKEEVMQMLLSYFSSSLERLAIISCSRVVNLWGEALTSLRYLRIIECSELRNLKLPKFLEELSIADCPELELWDGERRGVDWDSLPNLRLLKVLTVAETERLPDCLRRRHALGQFQVSVRAYFLSRPEV